MIYQFVFDRNTYHMKFFCLLIILRYQRIILHELICLFDHFYTRPKLHPFEYISFFVNHFTLVALVSAPVISAGTGLTYIFMGPTFLNSL